MYAGAEYVPLPYNGQFVLHGMVDDRADILTLQKLNCVVELRKPPPSLLTLVMM